MLESGPYADLEYSAMLIAAGLTIRVKLGIGGGLRERATHSSKGI
jgi:hypothetical protein